MTSTLLALGEEEVVDQVGSSNFESVVSPSYISDANTGPSKVPSSHPS